jgi:hypothetical protein
MAIILLPEQLTKRDQESKEIKPKYIVKLTESKRSQLKELISSGEASARQIRRAYILLKSDSSPEGPDWGYQPADL